MSMNRLKKLNIDTRTEADIEREVAGLAASYETGWIPDEENPDVGSALAKVFAGQVAENIGRMNEVLDRYHTEFVNMLDISLLPARPASCMVVCGLTDDTVPGTGIMKGTKLLTETEEPLVFETDHSVYVTSSKLIYSFMADRETGAIVPLKGDFENPELVEGQTYLADLDGVPEKSEDSEGSLRPFILFGEGGGIDRNVVAFYHSTVFDCENDDIFVKIEGGDKLIEDINEKRVRFAYISENGIKDYPSVSLKPDGCTFVLRKFEKNRKIELGEAIYSLLLMIAKEVPDESRRVSKISFSAQGHPVFSDSINNGSNDLSVETFLPFTDTLALYGECYVCQDNYFSKAGSRVTISFDLSFEEHKVSFTPEQIEDSLKVIKRKPKTATREIPGDCYADEIAVEYFNGTGWKKLPTTDLSNMFSSVDMSGHKDITFICPDDWVPTTAGAYEGRCIRIQVIKADNCYMRPCVHHYPIVKDLKIAYTYEDSYVDPERLFSIVGTKKLELTQDIKSDKGYLTFLTGGYADDALYLGFSQRMESGPISIFFNMADSLKYEGLRCRFEYYSAEGFKPMKVLDYTQDFTRSGVVMFLPPADFHRSELEGKNAYWIRVVRVTPQTEDEIVENLPHITDVMLNAVQVSNIETRPAQEFFVEEITPGMTFYLGVNNILDADVWVNEMGRHSRDRMQLMLAEEPDTTFAEYDIMGGITAFYKKWHEVTRLETSDDPRCYLLDRLQNTIIFGDGVNTWVPSVTDNVAIRLVVRCCNGKAGNVGVDMITDSQGYIKFIGDISNPVKAFGGSNIEEVETALKRGASILSSRNRLVTMQDYTRAILAYSDTIDQVKGIAGMGKNGKLSPGDLTFVLLMKDYAEGSYAFHRIAGSLNEYLLSKSEITVTQDKLHIVEPVFVNLSIAVWINVINMDDSFEIQNLMQQALSDYLDPVGINQGRGFKIGTLPKRSQLLMRLNGLKNKAIVKKSVVIASYRDESGYHEMDLEDVKITPFMVARNGNHKVHILN